MIIRIRDIEIDFPYTPYNAQVEYMTAVIDALDGSQRALLESPTGTGKTLCLLCACLGWVAHRHQKEPNLQLRRLSSSTVMGMVQAPAQVPLRIVYASRTHAQLAQVVRELKKSSYGANLQMAVLGSRDHMCLHPTVSQQPTSQSMTSACNHVRAEQKCRFFSRMQYAMTQPKRLMAISGADGVPFEMGEVASSHGEATEGNTAAPKKPLPGIHDIEDLAVSGRSMGFCPYFYERVMSRDASLVFLPYTYLFDPEVRKQLPFSLEDAIVIIDEAHNLPSVLNSCANTNLSPLDITNAVVEVSRALQMNAAELSTGESISSEKEMQLMMNEEAFGLLKLALSTLEGVVDELGNRGGKMAVDGRGPARGADVQLPLLELPRGVTVPQAEVVLKGSCIYDVLRAAAIEQRFWKNDVDGDSAPRQRTLCDVFNEVIAMLVNSDAGSPGLSRVQAFLSNVFSTEGSLAEIDEHCRVVLTGVPTGRSAAPRWTIGFWTLDTSASMSRAVAGTRSLLLTSGTLSPLDHFAAELGQTFGVMLQGSHVIDQSQVLCSVLCRGPAHQLLNGSYAHRDSVAYKDALGFSILNLSRNVPHGMLVFFPSYVALNGALDQWKSGSAGGEATLWAQLSELKTLFAEPTDASELQQVVRKYQAAAETDRGAMLFAVCRGKISEGVDFADRHGRCVVVAGIPYANQGDLFIRLKRQYLTLIAPHRAKVRGKLFTGDDWYRQEAMRSVNQAIGRVIRHKDDFGAVVLADERYVQQRDSVSGWLQRSLVVHERFGDAYGAVTKFFNSRTRKRLAPGGSTDAPATSTATAAQRQQGVVAPASAALAESYQATALQAAADAAAEAQLQQQLKARQELEKAHMMSTAAHKPKSVRFANMFAKETMAPFPEVPATLEVAPPAPPSSKVYCDRLRSQLPAELYARFRQVLVDVSTFVQLQRGNHALSPDAESGFAGIIARLGEVFQGGIPSDLEREKALLGFGAFLPAWLHATFGRLLATRKRERTDE